MVVNFKSMSLPFCLYDCFDFYYTLMCGYLCHFVQFKLHPSESFCTCVWKYLCVINFVLGEYSQNLCPRGDTSCPPCNTRLPSCIGLPDGQMAVPGREYTDIYVDCKQNRTMSVNHCSSGFFDPGLHICVTKINSGE